VAFSIPSLDAAEQHVSKAWQSAKSERAEPELSQIEGLAHVRVGGDGDIFRVWDVPKPPEFGDPATSTNRWLVVRNF